MTKPANGAAAGGGAWKNFAVALLCIGVALGILFRKSFQNEMVLFSNDAPLGLISSKAGGAASTIEGIFTGYWQDNVWIGIEQPSILPGLSFGAYQFFRDPVANAKFLAPMSLLFLGLSAWFAFRVFGFRQWVCVLGGLAAALNMNMLSHVAWGLPSRAFTQGAILLAIAGVYAARGKHPWIKYALAGMCVGLAVVEGFDIGAIFSLYVAAFAFYLSVTEGEPSGRKVVLGGARVAVLALCAGLFATQALITLIGTQIKGVENPGGKVESPQERWDGKTAWSLPKLETFRVLVPGLFGYRMDTEGGGNYWGSVGSPIFKRHSGAGEYAGVLIVLIALIGAANAFRKQNLYTEGERKLAIFWSIAALLSLLFAWGRHAPFYKIIYALPYFSTIRNPIKFMHAYHLAQWILFGLGLQLIARHYMAAAANNASGIQANFKRWWAAAPSFDRKTVFGLAAGLVASVLLFLIFYSSSGEFHNYLVSKAEFPDGVSKSIAKFAYGEVVKYLVVYAVSLAAILACLSGWFSGSRARLAPVILGAIIFADLGRAALPWIIHYDYKAKYASNEVFDFLKRKTTNARVTYRKYTPFAMYTLINPQLNFMESVLNEWHQNQFLYYDIPTLDVIQMSRPPEMDVAYKEKFLPLQQNPDVCARLWQLTATRYLIGHPSSIAELNGAFDPALKRFQVATNFDFEFKAGVDPRGNVGLDDVEWKLKADGKFSIIEFTGALPRYAIFTSWLGASNDTNALDTLANPAFDPLKQVIVSDAQITAPGSPTNAAASVRMLNYNPKQAEFQSESSAPAIVVMNDKWSPNWRVRVDGEPAQILRVNYIMRGVQVPAGSHKIEFRYEPPATGLYVSFGAMLVCALLCAFLAYDSRRPPTAV